jgi:vacuolar iron transporter family protein
MNGAFRTGLSFGLTSAVITTLGMIVGLNSGTHDRIVVIGGILIIALADALSDSLGIHLSEEARKNTSKTVWTSTISTFLFKFIFALTFLVPILLIPLATAVKVCMVWGAILLGSLSYYIARREKASPSKVITEHLLIALIVIIATNYLGNWISTFAG